MFYEETNLILGQSCSQIFEKKHEKGLFLTYLLAPWKFIRNSNSNKKKLWNVLIIILPICIHTYILFFFPPFLCKFQQFFAQTSPRTIDKWSHSQFFCSILCENILPFFLNRLKLLAKNSLRYVMFDPRPSNWRETCKLLVKLSDIPSLWSIIYKSSNYVWNLLYYEMMQHQSV